METIYVREVLGSLAGKYELNVDVLAEREGEYLFYSMLPLTERQYVPLFHLDFTWGAFYTTQFFTGFYGHVLQSDVTSWYCDIMDRATIGTELLHLADEALNDLCGVLA